MIIEIVGISGSGKTTLVKNFNDVSSKNIYSSEINLIFRIIALPLTIIFFLFIFLFNLKFFKILEYIKLSNYISAMIMRAIFAKLYKKHLVFDQFLLQFMISLKTRNIKGVKIVIFFIKILSLFEPYFIKIINIDEKVYIKRSKFRTTYTSNVKKINKFSYKKYHKILDTVILGLPKNISIKKNIKIFDLIKQYG
jgi:hypothetical protein